MFENPRRGRQARNFTKNVPKIQILDLNRLPNRYFLKIDVGCPWCLFAKRINEKNSRNSDDSLPINCFSPQSLLYFCDPRHCAKGSRPLGIRYMRTRLPLPGCQKLVMHVQELQITAHAPFSYPEPLGLICNEPLVSRPRNQETTGSGDEDAHARNGFFVPHRSTGEKILLPGAALSREWLLWSVF